MVRGGEALRIGKVQSISRGRAGAGLLLVGLSLVLGVRAVQAGRGTVRVWAAARDLPPGRVLAAGDLAPAEVKLGSTQVGLYLPLSSNPLGKALLRGAREGELILARDLGTGGTGMAEMAIPLKPGSAPPLRPGDRIMLVATFGKGTPEARTEVVLEGATVLYLLEPGKGILGQESGTGVVVSVEPTLALKLAAALAGAEVAAVKLPPQE